MPRPGRLVLSLLALAALGCGNPTATPGPTTPTLIAVSSADFSGDVPCTNAPGAMRTFVATIFDLGTLAEPTDPFPLPSSVVNDGSTPPIYRPAGCENPAGFGFVIPGHRYDAEIDAYDRTDLGAVGAGSRYLVDDKTGEYVPPRWTTSCGRKTDGSPAEGPVTAAQYLTRFVRGCAPLESHTPETTTGITVSLADALGALACGADPGQVALFTAELVGSGNVGDPVPCGQSIEFDNLEPGRNYSFAVRAFENQATEARWVTSCFRTAQKGALVSAACDPLTDPSLQSADK